MRRTVILLAGVGAMMAGASAARADSVSWGVKGGLVLASVATTGPDAFDSSPDAGGAIGAFVAVDLGHGVRIQPELLWSTRRFSATGVPSPFSVSSRSVELPVLVHVRFPEGRRTQALVFAGPQLSIVGNVRQSVGPDSTDISDQIRDRDLGVTFGGGVERTLATGALVIEARMTVGTSNLREAGAGELKGRGVQALVGYRF